MKSISEGHVVESYMIGNTRVKICDDCCVKTPEQVQKILDRIGNNFFEHLCVPVPCSSESN